MGSRSARQLANTLSIELRLRVRRIKSHGRYRPKSRSLVINYGSSTIPGWGAIPRDRWLNTVGACMVGGNKLNAFNAFAAAEVPTPEWTESIDIAQRWINDGNVVVCRTILNGHGGIGIHLSDAERPLVRAPLYVKYKKKRKEFRVHVFKGQVIDVSEKRKMSSIRRPEKFDGYIRNHINGWVFCRDSVVEPIDLRPISLAACAACGLDFGAVDVIWNEHENKCYVLEINTAPGLEGTTLQRYKQACLQWIQSR